jgi:uncharacterized protein YlxP (DUF503 family)
MIIGIYSFELHLAASRSLKNKRQVVRRLKDRLRSRYNIAISEMNDHSDKWQRAALVVVSVAEGREPLVQLFEAIHREAERHVPGDVIEMGSEFIDGEWS